MADTNDDGYADVLAGVPGTDVTVADLTGDGVPDLAIGADGDVLAR
ncbi:hypothetical protein [Streptomyces bauhiniae]